ncbi:MAG: Lrp/AsnC family transcriptional regulator [Candidatus Bathyarchaeota archaeon]|nr:Lrp/AsnC family transcriptional regulator [Candidatus Bathyarchaeota archaeon]
MTSTVNIDAIDNQILHLLLKDARLSLKQIANECHVSQVSVFNRINRLKKLGVITGATLLAPLDTYGFKLIAFIGIETEITADINEVLRFITEHTILIEALSSIGKYDLHGLIYAEDFDSLNNRVEMLKRINGIRKVAFSVFSGFPTTNYDQLNLNTNEG